MKAKKFKPYAFISVKEEKNETSNSVENCEHPENSCSYALSDFCVKDESFKEKIRNDSGVKKIIKYCNNMRIIII